MVSANRTFGIKPVFQMADQIKVNNTLIDSTNLVIPLSQGRKYSIRGVCFVTSDDIPDFKGKFVSITGASLTWFLGNSSFGGQANFDAQNFLVVGNNETNINIYGVLELSTSDPPASLQFQFAQNTTSGANPTTLKAGSWLQVTDIGAT